VLGGATGWGEGRGAAGKDVTKGDSRSIDFSDKHNFEVDRRRGTSSSF